MSIYKYKFLFNHQNFKVIFQWFMFWKPYTIKYSSQSDQCSAFTIYLKEDAWPSCLNYNPRSIVAVPTCQCLIQLQPGQRYLISVRAVNIGGPSDRSEPITITTTGEKQLGSAFSLFFAHS